MFRTPIYVIDFEGSRQSGILEYGVVTVAEGRIMAAETQLCGATGTISDQDKRQHGLSEAAVAGAPPFADAWMYFAGLRERGAFCAHSAAVEDGLLRSVWPYPRRSPDFSSEGGTVVSWGPWLDTLALYRRIYPGLASYKLEQLVGLFGLGADLDVQAELYCPDKRGRYHCALYDALASALLLLRLQDEPELRPIRLSWLLAQSAASETERESREQRRLF